MKKLVIFCAALTLTLALLPVSATAYTEDAPFAIPLLAGQHIYAGVVEVWNDDSDLHVKYNTTNGWSLTETHLHIATTLAGIPQKNGNPAPGQFDYKAEHDQELSYEYEIPLDTLAGAGLCIAAHAVVCKGGEGEPTLAQGVLASPTLWAGQHINCGSAVVGIEGDDLVVTYETTDGWKLTETHLYIGAEPPAKSAPGRFPYKHENLGGVSADTYSIPLSSLSAEPGDTLYLAAHAVVQKPARDDETCQEETAWAEGERIRKKGNWSMFFSVTIPDVSSPGQEPESISETAWGFGLPFPGMNWATFFIYVVE